MDLDLSAVPILDQHCHPLLREGSRFGAAEYQRFFSESDQPAMYEHHAATTIFFRWALEELAAFLGCAATVDDVLAARAALGDEALASRMFRDARLATLLLDHGYQTGESL